MPSPLPERPTLKRATYASKPRVPHRHRARPKAKTHRVVHAKKATHARKAPHKSLRHRRPAAHRPADHRPILHRVTYASPLCAQRSTMINDMLGLPDYDITQPAIAADSLPGEGALPSFIDLPPAIGGGTSTGGGGGPSGPGPITFPGGPIYPVGPGPIIVPPTGPDTPPVVTPPTPPVTPPAVPEPSSWAMMLMGMVLIGSSIRRRRTVGKAA